MQKFELVIHNPTGLHARPARFLVDIAKQFHSSIQVRYGSKQVNAKSLISLLTLGVPSGQQIELDVNGVDEEAAAQALVAAVREGLGEGGAIAQSPKSPPGGSGYIFGPAKGGGRTGHQRGRRGHPGCSCLAGDRHWAGLSL